ncbi:MAG TPA: carbohydrate-binding family 9-like protein [Vicinamibacterales bacterium]|nr:carbohydrate-binding family 9-like protein [Vicinamibacterales bacterium]
MYITACFQSDPPPLATDLDHPAWRQAAVYPIDRSWRGDPAPPGLGTAARVLWTASHLWFAFDCRFTELDADTEFDTSVKRHALWERDVCEAFVRSPNESGLDSYKEFEVAPTGQWCDAAIHRPRVKVDFTWRSGMETAARVEPEDSRFRAVMRVPFGAFGIVPETGDRWHANLFRICRWDGARQYLALAATGTAVADFHVPERFVELVFAGAGTGINSGVVRLGE